MRSYRNGRIMAQIRRTKSLNSPQEIENYDRAIDVTEVGSVSPWAMASPYPRLEKVMAGVDRVSDNAPARHESGGRPGGRGAVG